VQAATAHLYNLASQNLAQKALSQNLKFSRTV